MSERALPPPRVAVYNNPKVRAAFYQLLLLAAVLWLGYQFALNAKSNLEAQNVTSGFGFLDRPAGFGVNSKNVDEALKSNLPEIRRLLGVEGNFGEQIGLSKDWIVLIVKQVGNYGESFERNVGTGSKLGISRGINRLWTKGGIQYAPPVR